MINFRIRAPRSSPRTQEYIYVIAAAILLLLYLFVGPYDLESELTTDAIRKDPPAYPLYPVGCENPRGPRCYLPTMDLRR